ncbi:MAG: hypothetical protein ACREV4_06765 [Gammaproteobacteria bacterium]
MDLVPRFARYHDYLTRLPRRVRRQLQRQWRRSLAGLALLLALGQAPVLASTIAVDGTTCTLIDAITAANSDAIAGGCAAGSGPDILELVAGSTHTLTAVNNTTFGPTGLPVIGTEITIEGHGSTITRSSADAFRIFAVDGNLTLNETTVSGGSLVVEDGLDDGAGIANYGSTLTLTDSTVQAIPRTAAAACSTGAPRP